MLEMFLLRMQFPPFLLSHTAQENRNSSKYLANIDHSLPFQFETHVLQEYFHFIYANSEFFPLGEPVLPISSVLIAFQTIFSREGNGILFLKSMSALGENTFKLRVPTEAVVCLDK